MLTICRTVDGQLQALSDIGDGCWINLIDPLLAEMNRVSEKLGIPLE